MEPPEQCVEEGLVDQREEEDEQQLKEQHAACSKARAVRGGLRAWQEKGDGRSEGSLAARDVILVRLLAPCSLTNSWKSPEWSVM